MSDVSQCDIHETNPATDWCSECEQALCDECVVYHSQARASINHGTIKIEEFRKLPPFITTLRKLCDEHNEKSNFFCPIHEKLCCFYCIQNHHKQCHGVDNLKKLSENIKQSVAMSDAEMAIFDLKSNFIDVIEDRKQNIENMEAQKIEVLKEISELKQWVIERFNELETSIIKDIAEAVAKEKVRLDKIVTEFTEKMSDVDHIHDNMESIKRYASSIDAYIALKEISKNVETEKSFLNTIENDTSLFCTELRLEQTENVKELFSGIESLGKLVILSKPHTVKFIDRKNNQAQLFVTDSTESVSSESKTAKAECSDLSSAGSTETVSPERTRTKTECSDSSVTESVETVSPESTTKAEPTVSSKPDDIVPPTDNLKIALTFEETFTIPYYPKQISALKIKPNGKVLFLDHHGSKLVTFDKTKNTLDWLNLSSSPVDMCFNDFNQLIVTLYTNKTMVVYDYATMSEVTTIQTVDRCFGVDFGDSKYFVSLPRINSIQIFENDFGTFSPKTILTRYTAYYIAYHKGNLYCSNHNDNVVFCVSMSSEQHLWDFQFNTFKAPLCLTVGPNDRLFITCRRSRTVHAISKDGKNHQCVLKKVEGIYRPRALDYVKETNTIDVCDEGSNLVFVYNVDQTVFSLK